MTSARTSKVAARRRAREATRRANAARAALEKANIEDAADYMVAKAVVADVDAWESERLTIVTRQVRVEADRRRADARADAAASVRLMQERGETLAAIAELTGDGVGEVRAMLRHAPRTETSVTVNGSDALGGGVAQSAPPSAAGGPEATSA